MGGVREGLMGGVAGRYGTGMKSAHSFCMVIRVELRWWSVVFNKV